MLSCIETVFNQAKPLYQDALKASGYTHELKYKIHSLNITETQITEKTGAGAGEPSGLILHGTPVLRLMSEPSSCKIALHWSRARS